MLFTETIFLKVGCLNFLQRYNRHLKCPEAEVRLNHQFLTCHKLYGNYILVIFLGYFKRVTKADPINALFVAVPVGMNKVVQEEPLSMLLAKCLILQQS